MEEPKKENQPAAAPAPAHKGGNENDMLMGVLAYLGILCLIPLLAAKDSEFAQYHAKQGLTLFVAEVVVYAVFWIAAFIFWPLFLISWVIWIGFLVLAILGIVNVTNHKMAPLPLIGGIHLMK
jgi:uncharacterized membrane protein